MSRSFAGTSLTTRPSIASSPDEIASRPAIMRKRRRLAAARGAEQHHELAVRDREADVVDREVVRPLVALAELVERDGGHRSASVEAVAADHFTAPAVMPWISFSEKNT